MSTKARNILLVLAGTMLCIGFADATFLFYKYITADPINCFIFDGCNTVAKSPYAYVFGIPLPAFGLIFYGVMLGIFGALVFIRRNIVKTLFLLGGLVGFLFSLWFVYLQGFVIGAFCIYCLISAADSVVIFCTAIMLFMDKQETLGKVDGVY
jgi:uncharacterized membrane protein